MLFSCVNLVKVTYLFSTALFFTSIIFRISNISILFCVVYMCWCMVYAYVRVCVCVHVCIWVYVSMTRAFVWRTQADVFLNCSPLYFSRQGLTEPGVYRFSSAGWPVSARKVCLSHHAPLCPAYDVALGAWTRSCAQPSLYWWSWLTRPFLFYVLRQGLPTEPIGLELTMQVKLALNLQ